MSSSQPLSHLNSVELLELMNRYYAGERVSALLQGFKIHCSVGLLCSHFPPEPTHEICRFCDAAMIRPRRSRSWRYSVELRCSQCAHFETTHCKCPGCQEVRRLAEQKQLQQQSSKVVQFCLEHWSYNESAVEPSQLSALEALAFISLVRCGGWLDEYRIGPLQASSIPFAPSSPCFQADLIDRLITVGLVSPDMSSSLTAFSGLHGKILNWDLEKVQWLLRIPVAADFVHALEDVVASSAWPQNWKMECTKIWHELAVAECKEFCAYSVSQRDLPMPGATAVSALVENLLRDFSVSQCYQLIWASASDATDYRVRKGITARHAANYLIGVCQRRADRSRAEGWTIKGFHRNFQLGRSQISYVLHDVFLKHGEIGFFACPNPLIDTPDKQAVRPD